VLPGEAAPAFGSGGLHLLLSGFLGGFFFRGCVEPACSDGFFFPEASFPDAFTLPSWVI